MRLIALSLLFCLLLTGCKVGPDYHPPDTPMPSSFSEDRCGETCAISDEDLIEWWTFFNDPLLNQLLEESICGSFDYRIALAQVYQARSQYWVQFTQILPQIEMDGLATRYRTSRSFATSLSTPSAASNAALPPVHNFFQLGLDAIWEIDLFGKLRRSADASYDLWQATAAEARAVKIIVLSEVAATYTTICALQRKISLQSEFVSLDEELLNLSTSRFNAGLANAQEIEGYSAALESEKAALMLLETDLRQSIYSLSILLGRNPEDLIDDFQIARPIPYATGRVPAGIPADLLRRRPDIRKAERQLAAATEQIGIAVAQLFPSISLAGSSSSYASNPLQGANIGYSSDNISRLFKPASRIWGIGAFIEWPIFDFGQRVSNVNTQISLEQQSYLSYQKTVVSALEETESALVAYFNEEERLKDISRQATANENSYRLTEDLFQSGLGDYSQALQARAVWLTALNTLTESQQAVTTDLISIYKAMGGDW